MFAYGRLEKNSITLRRSGNALFQPAYAVLKKSVRVPLREKSSYAGRLKMQGFSGEIGRDRNFMSVQTGGAR